MAKHDGIQYVRYYSYGSAAVKAQPAQAPERRRQPKAEPIPQAEPIEVPFCPMAVFGTLVAVVMMICVVIGFVQVNRVNDEIRGMETYINGLRSENYALNKEYHAGYDLDEIRAAAEAMGLVPVDQVEHITIRFPEPEVVEELPWYQQLWNDFMDMIE